MRSEYIIWVHKDSSIKTLDEFVNSLTSIAYGWSISDLLQYKDENGEVNLEKIYYNYSIEDQAKYKVDYFTDKSAIFLAIPGYQFKTSLLAPNTPIIIPKNKLNREVLIGEGTQVDTKEYEAFLGEKLKELLLNSKYYPINKIQLNNSQGIIKDSFPQITVWLWSRALSNKPEIENTSQEGSDIVKTLGELKGTIIDLSPYIMSCTTNVGKMGGNFSIQLPALMGKWNETLGWVIEKKSIIQQQNGEFISVVDLQKRINGELGRNSLYFPNILFENDIIWIRYETLANELPDRLKESRLDEISKSKLPSKTYDMIGLVDSCTEIKDFESGEISIQVSGRDFIKSLIEDGCYFFPLDYMPEGTFSNETDDRWLRRIEGQLVGLSQSAEKSIEYSLKFIINALSNMGICPDDLFDAYGNVPYFEDITGPQQNVKTRDERSYQFRLDTAESKIFNQNYTTYNDTYKENVVKYIKLSREDAGLIEDDTIVEDIYIQLKEFISQADSVGALLGVGVGWKGFNYNGENLVNNEYPSYFIDRLFKDTNINSNSVIATDNTITEYLQGKYLDNYKSPYNEEICKGIWQIIKLVIDDEVRERRIVDSSIGNETGSLINQVMKICQEPFVEFRADTYKDQYYLIARKPPFTKNKIKEWVDKNLVINISDTDILQETLGFSQNSAYSWYRIQPMILGGESNILSWVYLKAVNFPEYANIWGNKAYDIISNYISHFPSDSSTSDLNVATAIKQGIYDLKFLIDINAYMPFTREGTIILEGGDRRIKSGTWIRLLGTKELGYVESVTNSYAIGTNAIQRQTIINLSHIMVEKYIFDSEFNYFNIINTEINESIFFGEDNYEEWLQKTTGNWSVNKKSFNFFLRKGQMNIFTKSKLTPPLA